ncbi:hypothetical protein TNCV_1068491 [Trichonephila clavipes]|nr:hypothetical protein TNCV_1068491 [Trichonephila clavipes]
MQFWAKVKPNQSSPKVLKDRRRLEADRPRHSNQFVNDRSPLAPALCGHSISSPIPRTHRKAPAVQDIEWRSLTRHQSPKMSRRCYQSP